MSGIGSEPDEYAPGNRPDGSYYDLLPESSQPGLFGGLYADMQANAPRMANLDLSEDGTGLPPSVSVAPDLPQRNDVFSNGPPLEISTDAQPLPPRYSSISDALDDVALHPPFNMSDQALAAIRNRAENQVRMDSVERESLGPLAAVIVPELGAPKWVEGIVSGMMDLYNNKSALQEEQAIKDASDGAVFNPLNDSENQQIRGRSTFPIGQGRIP